MTRPDPEAVLHLCTLHLLSRAGFASTSRAASLTLSAALAQYFRAAALACLDRAAEAGRAQPGALDVQQGLEDLGVGGVPELYEWAAKDGEGEGTVWRWPEDEREDGWGELEKEWTGMKNWGGKEGLAELSFMPDEEVERILRMQSVTEADDDDEDEDDEMAVDADATLVEELDRGPALPDPWRSGSPDFSWLPPIPSADGSLPGPHSPTRAQPTSKTAPTIAPLSTNMSLLERYERRIPYSASQLAQSRTFTDPPRPPGAWPPALPPGSSSLPSLIEVWAKTSKRGVSSTLPQHEYRKHITSLLRLSVAPADELSPRDTLAGAMPAPRASPFVPSYSETQNLPAHPVPIDPHPTGMLAQLVRQVRSPHLPPKLRDRLLSVRPPVLQKRDGQPIKYQAPVPGPSRAALELARGKQPPEDEEEELLYPTWGDLKYDGTPRWKIGALPSDSAVKISKTGEATPRRINMAQGEAMPRRIVMTPGYGVGASAARQGQAEAQAQAQDQDPAPAPAPSRFRLRMGSITMPPLHAAAVGAGANASSGGAGSSAAAGAGGVGMARKDASGSGSGPGSGGGGASSPAPGAGPVRIKLSTRGQSGTVSPRHTSAGSVPVQVVGGAHESGSAAASGAGAGADGPENEIISLDSPTDPVPLPSHPAPPTAERPRPRISLSFGRPKAATGAAQPGPEPGAGAMAGDVIVDTPLTMHGQGRPAELGGATQGDGQDGQGDDEDEEDVPLAQKSRT